MSLPAPWLNTSRIYKLTVISHNLTRHIFTRKHLPGSSGTHWVASGKVVLVVLGLLLLSGCASVRPIVKIGLIAPFEGLYRQSGYAALDAMRQAMTECTPAGVDVLPLALDDGGDPAQAQRAAQKLLVDPTVRAVVGPLLLDNVPAVATVITPTTGIPWYIPPLVTSTAGFASPTSAAWLDNQIEYVANSTEANRVLLLGLPSDWQLPIKSSAPFVRVDTMAAALATVADGDALLWLGPPDVGARWLTALRQVKPKVDFWLADQAGLEIFAAQNTDHKDVRWLLWHDSDYTRWSKSDGSVISPNDAMRYLTYRATCAALSNLGSAASANGEPNGVASWELQGRSLP